MKLKKFRIGLDMDGVIYDWHSVVHRYYMLYANYTGTFREFWMEYIPSLSEENQDYIVSIPLFYDQAFPTVDAQEYLPKLAEIGELFYITSRPDSARFVTRKFFRKHNLPDSENLFMVADKQPVIRLYDIDVFVDDRGETLEDLGNICLTVLMNKPWNEHYKDTFTRVNSLQEFYELLTR